MNMLKRMMLLSPDGDGGTQTTDTQGGQQTTTTQQTTNATQTDTMIKFTPDQFKDRMAQLERSMRQKLEAEGLLISTEMRDQLAEQARVKEEEEQKKLKSQGQYEKLWQESTEALKQTKTAMQKREAELQEQINNKTLDSAIQLAVLKNTDARTDLTESIQTLLKASNSVKVENGEVFITDRNGTKLYSEDPQRVNEPMTIDEYLGKWLAMNDWAMRPTGAGGSGTTRTTASVKSIPQDAYTNPNAYALLSEEQKQVVRKSLGMDATNVSTMFDFIKKRSKE